MKDEPAPPEALGLAWAGSHPQPYPKPEDVWRIKNVNNQIEKNKEKTCMNKRKGSDEGDTLFDLGDDKDFPPLIKEVTQEENPEEFSFMEEGNSLMEIEEKESLVILNYKCSDKDLVTLRRKFF